MKKIITIFLFSALVANSCSDFTELQPKGKNLLETSDQLEMLLNSDNISFSSMDLWQMTGDIIYSFSNIPTSISNPVKTKRVIQWTWDEANMDLMADLTASDYDYNGGFSAIGKICNPILSKVDKASGSQEQKDRIKCEALVMRAYFEYIMVNKFAKAYNPASACLC